MEIEGFGWGWRFALGHEETDATKVRPEAAEVDLPHNAVPLPYNCFDEHSYRRDFSYWKEFDLDQLDGKSVLLRFEGFMAQADIYLNGLKLGHFISLYFPVGIDVTSAARVGKNLLYVHLDADEDPGIPPFGGAIDYLTYAGIYRPVHLEVVPESHFSSVFVKANAKGEVEVKCSLSGENGSIDYTIYDGDDLVMESTSPRFLVDSPRLWCPSDPHLYELRVSHAVNGEIEERRIRFGFRDVMWKEDGFYLNGKHMKLTGLNRHQSYPYIGYAAPARLQKEDALIMKRGGVDVVRTSHYLDGEAFLEACDEIGLLVIDEVPGWQYLGKSEEWRKNYCSFIEGLVLSSFNHPSVIAHGVRIDESPDDHDLYRRGNNIARTLDPTRPTLGVRNFKRSELLEDIYAYNDFYGSLRKALISPSKAGAKHHPYLVSEHTGHMNPTKATDSFSQLISQAKDHERKIDAFYKEKNIAACIGWCFADYNTHATFGSGDMVCAHGVYDMFRNPKPAAYVYAAQKDDRPFFELLTDFKGGEFKEAALGEIPVATNCDYFDLFRNGKFVKRFHPKRAKKGIPHPLFYVDEVVGDALSDPRFVGKDRAMIAHLLSLVSITILKGWKIPDYLKAVYLVLKYRLRYQDLVDLFNKETSSWGGDGKGNTYLFVAYKGGEEVARREFGVSSSFDFVLEAGSDVLVNGNTYDATSIHVRYVDQHMTTMRFASRVLHVKAEGPIELLSPEEVPLLGGATTVYVRSKRGSGTGKLHFSLDGLEKEMDILVK